MAASPAALFDLGIYPAAVPAAATRPRPWRGVPDDATRRRFSAVLDEIEGYSSTRTETRVSTRGSSTPVTLDDGNVVDAWAYFYNAPLGRAERIASGDYLEYLKSARS